MYDNWVTIEGHILRKKERFDLMRMQAYIVGKFGNSNPKKYPKSVQQFMPSPYDEDEKPAQRKSGIDIMREHEELKKRAEELKKNKKVATPEEAAAFFNQHVNVT